MQFCAHLLKLSGRKAVHYRLCVTLAGVLYLMPRARNYMAERWKLVGIWERLVPARRSAPISSLMVLALAECAIRVGLISMAALLLVGFDGVLRSSELFSLKRSDIYFASGKAVVRLRETKVGQRKGQMGDGDAQEPMCGPAAQDCMSASTAGRYALSS